MKWPTLICTFIVFGWIANNEVLSKDIRPSKTVSITHMDPRIFTPSSKKVAENNGWDYEILPVEPWEENFQFGRKKLENSVKIYYADIDLDPILHFQFISKKDGLTVLYEIENIRFLDFSSKLTLLDISFSERLNCLFIKTKQEVVMNFDIMAYYPMNSEEKFKSSIKFFDLEMKHHIKLEKKSNNMVTINKWSLKQTFTSCHIGYIQYLGHQEKDYEFCEQLLPKIDPMLIAYFNNSQKWNEWNFQNVLIPLKYEGDKCVNLDKKDNI